MPANGLRFVEIRQKGRLWNNRLMRKKNPTYNPDLT
jgi:hypothetical protein